MTNTVIWSLACTLRAPLGLAIAVGLVAGVAFLPLSEPVLPLGDKGNHVVAFLALSCVSRLCGVAVAEQLVRLSVLAVLIEGLQALPFIAREASVMDAMASLAGLFIGILFQLIFGRTRAVMSSWSGKGCANHLLRIRKCAEKP